MQCCKQFEKYIFYFFNSTSQQHFKELKTGADSHFFHIFFEQDSQFED